ncbi:phenylalanine--tRNA ligase subunit beta [Demequina muriae]|uniref:Phenylalanine--tRNA ligase beta subunit n=1 Tax=Demequina muriae TaxID=3051664 RepID=A0ABT8GDF7_9MICO|nr:phenylalanine--tRNA ligase subunit beta [Demequina sp. EGI L300058]MDN4479468.1 phenylalanine--tRNA ligase subunit beta [Demequina sp. EGI L300058]
MPKIPLNWLAESVDLAPGHSAEDVAAALAKVGLEEEGIEGGGVTGPLVIGRVLSVTPEVASNGKTINYCRVDVGGHNDPAGPGHKPDNKDEYPESKGIVCGAHNFAEGDYVVCILPGGVLPGPFPIGGRKTYGHWSDGMICSAKELGLGEESGGIVVLASPSGASEVTMPGVVADEDLVPGKDAIPLLGLDEQVLEINVTPDRGYSFSVRGVAREYCHATGQTFTDPAAIEVTGSRVADAARTDAFEVTIDDKAPVRGTVGCDRFATRVLRGFNPAAPSPSWMKRRLEQSGMRSISLAVDVTNYVMLELGQPLHAYDLEKVVEPIVVRRAVKGEVLETLDDVERKLDPEDLLITDSAGGEGYRPIGMAGVMGGALTEVSASTVDILLEGAHFDPITVARTARRHKLGSEASRRFERGVDTALAPIAVERALRLMQEFGGGELDELWTDLDLTVAPTPIAMDAGYPSRIVGVEYTADAVVEALEIVGCAVTREGDQLSVTPPTWRPDLELPINLVEEVARLQGYDDLPSVLPVAPPGRGYTHGQRLRRSVARTLAESGLTEVLTYPFMSETRLDEMRVPEGDIRRDSVRLANPLSAEYPLLRTTLMATLVDSVKVNLARGAQDVAVYELGRAYRASRMSEIPKGFTGDTITPDDVQALDAALGEQPRRAAGIMTGHRVRAGWNGHATSWDWTDALAAVERIIGVAGVEVRVVADAVEPWHPGRCATYYLGDNLLGVAGEMHPKVLETLGLPPRTVAFEIVLDPLIEATEGAIYAAEAVSQQVLAKEDFAFVVAEDVAAGDLVSAVRDAGGDLVESARVFDVYTGEQVGEGKKSLAVNVVMRAADHTLSADEVLGVREAIIAKAESDFGAVLR